MSSKSNEELLKPCKFVDLRLGDWFKWGKHTYSKTREYRPESKNRNNAVGIHPQRSKNLKKLESAWRCSFDDDTMVIPTKLITTTPTDSEVIKEALEDISRRICLLTYAQAKPFGVDQEIGFLTKIQNLLTNQKGASDE